MRGLRQKAVVFAGLLILAAGCEEQSQLSRRELNLLADENHRLKQELQGCEGKAAEKNKGIADCQNEKAAAEDAADKTTKLLMDLIGEYENKNTALKQENETLNAQIQELREQINSLKSEN